MSEKNGILPVSGHGRGGSSAAVLMAEPDVAAGLADYREAEVSLAVGNEEDLWDYERDHVHISGSPHDLLKLGVAHPYAVG